MNLENKISGLDYVSVKGIETFNNFHPITRNLIIYSSFIGFILGADYLAENLMNYLQKE
jgi:hypothetical protein